MCVWEGGGEEYCCKSKKKKEDSRTRIDKGYCLLPLLSWTFVVVARVAFVSPFQFERPSTATRDCHQSCTKKKEEEEEEEAVLDNNNALTAKLPSHHII